MSALLDKLLPHAEPNRAIALDEAHHLQRRADLESGMDDMADWASAQPARLGARLRLIDLNASQVYVTPQGYRCQLVPRDDDSAGLPWLTFKYLEGTAALQHGFTLNPANIGLLRRGV